MSPLRVSSLFLVGVVLAGPVGCGSSPPPAPKPAPATQPATSGPKAAAAAHRADEGSYRVSVNGVDLMKGQFTLRADGSYLADSTLSYAGQTVKTSITIKTDAGRWSEATIKSPTGEVTVRHAPGKALITSEGKTVSHEIPDDAPIFDGQSLALLGEVFERYDVARGGKQTVKVVMLGGKALDFELVPGEPVKRPVSGGGEAVFERYTLVIDSDMSLTIWLGSDRRVVGLEAQSQHALIVRDGFESVVTPTEPDDPLLSKPSHEVAKETLFAVMRDGKKLATDIYRPKDMDKAPVILIRTPYSKDVLEMEGTYWARRGYVCAIQDVRGRFSSEGTWEPFLNEGKDGYDTIEWLAVQPWSTGKVGMIGGSYVGWVQWWAAALKPPHLVTIIPNVSPPDPFFNIPYEYGVFFLGGAIWWADILETKATADLSGAAMKKVGELKFSQLNSLPVIDLDKKILGKENPYWRAWIAHPEDDAFWAPARFRDKLASITIPVFHQSGWFDGDGIGTKLNYAGVAAGKKATQKLILGPWGHTDKAERKVGDKDFGPQALLDLPREYLRWFDHYLKGVDNGIEKEPLVKVFVMGENKWLTGQTYPLEGTKLQRWYLGSDGHANGAQGDGRLAASEKTSGKSDKDIYDYDPGNPTPMPDFYEAPEQEKGTTVSAEERKRRAEAQHEQVINERKDILVYTSEPLTEPLRIAGPISAVLSASSSARDTDWFVTLVDIDEKGKHDSLVAGRLRARFRRSVTKAELLEPNQVYEFTLDLWHIGTTIPAGHRLRVEIASAQFPLFSRNLNTGGHNETEMTFVTAKQTIFHGGKRQSYIVLPVVPAAK